MSVDALTAYQWYFGEIDREMSESRLSSMLSKVRAFTIIPSIDYTITTTVTPTH